MASSRWVVCLTTVLVLCTTAWRVTGQQEAITRAIANLSVGTARGFVTFCQMEENKQIFVSGNVTGLSPGKHGFHVHMYGDISTGCKAAGPHFNPADRKHGAPDDDERHVGDLGNIEADSNGVATFEFYDPLLCFQGANSIIGRAVVVHEKEDDLGRTSHPESPKTGNAGGRVGCGIIAVAAP